MTVESVSVVRQQNRGGGVAPSDGTSMQETEPSRERSGWRRPAQAVGAAVLVGAGVMVASGDLYTPRSDFGFNLGVIGSLLMLLTLLGYPLRKHLGCLQGWGALKHWFRLHMVFGLLGPLLVLFHSTFHIRTLNAAVAMVSMLLVVASGVIGRYLYTQIHFGLYGHRATLEALQEGLSASAHETKSKLHFAPNVEGWLRQFEAGATATGRRFLLSLWWFLTLRVRRRIVEDCCEDELRRLMRAERRPEFPGGAPQAVRLVSSYLLGVQRVAHFTTYERIFSLWHVLHIPLIYILVGSGIIHVVAVYMY